MALAPGSKLGHYDVSALGADLSGAVLGVAVLREAKAGSSRASRAHGA